VQHLGDDWVMGQSPYGWGWFPCKGSLRADLCSCHVMTQGESIICDPELSPSVKFTKSASALKLNFSVSGTVTVRNKFLLFISHTVYVCFVNTRNRQVSINKRNKREMNQFMI
jgi:hypothetical protein